LKGTIIDRYIAILLLIALPAATEVTVFLFAVCTI